MNPPPRHKLSGDQLTEQALQAFSNDQTNNLAAIILAMIPASAVISKYNNHASRAADILAIAVWRTVRGDSWKQISRDLHNLPWSYVSGFTGAYPVFSRLWQLAKDAGEDYRRKLRDDEAHRRAVKGWKEPVFYQGILCGSVRRFSDRLLEMLHKEDHPDRYAKDGATNINLNVMQLMESMKGHGIGDLVKDPNRMPQAAPAIDVDEDGPPPRRRISG